MNLISAGINIVFLILSSLYKLAVVSFKVFTYV